MIRKKTNSLQAPMLLTNQVSLTAGVRSLFASPTAPLYVDLGTGRGQFLFQMCPQNSHINWIGIEKSASHLLIATKQQKQQRLTNLHYLWMDVNQLPDVFKKGEVDRFYLNFPTPWKESHLARMQLTHRRFLKMYQKILSKQGDLIFKTDHEDLYSFTKQELQTMNWTIIEDISDYHLTGSNGILTEWENIALKQDLPIYYLHVSPPAVSYK